jgi:hypothetical protein
MPRWKPGDTWKSPVAVTARSKTSKLGDVAATHASQASCPGSHPDDPDPCAFLHGDCYAERQGMQPFTTRRLNSNKTTDPNKIAKLEAREIDALPADRKLRVHVVGDSKTDTAAALVGAAMVRYTKRGGFDAWSYTHAWRSVDRSSWAGASVLASVHDADGIREARDRGYAAAIATGERHPSRSVYTIDGERIVPCPAQFAGGPTCADCKICQRPEVLLERKYSVGFQPDALPKR